jgi:hypothetical protein
MRYTSVTSKVSQRDCESFTKERLENVMFFVWLGCCVHRGTNAVKWAVKHILMSRIYKEKKAKAGRLLGLADTCGAVPTAAVVRLSPPAALWDAKNACAGPQVPRQAANEENFCHMIMSASYPSPHSARTVIKHAPSRHQLAVAPALPWQTVRVTHHLNYAPAHTMA